MYYCKKVTSESVTYFKVNKYGLILNITPMERKRINIDEIDKICPVSYVVMPLRDRPDNTIFRSHNRLLKCNTQTANIEYNNYLRIELGSPIPNRNFLRIYGVHTYDSEKCLIMEYVDNAITFENMIGSNPDNILSIAQQSFSALSYLHSLGIIHGDIANGKNILYVEDEDRVIIIDFENDQHFNPNNLSERDIKYIKDDQKGISLLLWLMIDGDINHDVYADMNERDDYSSFIQLIQEHRTDYDEDHQKVIDVILLVYNNEFIPTNELSIILFA